MPEAAIDISHRVSRAADDYRCPLCGDSRLARVAEHNAKRLLRCRTCGVGFLCPRPARSELAGHFSDAAPLTERDLKCRFETNRSTVLASVAAYIRAVKPAGNILDVGCATGLFLSRFFSDAGWRTFAVELNGQKAGIAASRGIRVHCGDLQSAEHADDSFDVVTVLDAFYYFLEPQAVLDDIHRILKPGGILVVELPLAGSRIWRASGRLGRSLTGERRHLLESSDHLFYYDPRSISRLLEASGFRVSAVVPLPGNRQERPLRNLIYRAYSCLSLALYLISRSKCVLGPRFLVAATKAGGRRRHLAPRV